MKVKRKQLDTPCRAGISNSNCSEGQRMTYKVARGRIMTLTRQ